MKKEVSDWLEQAQADLKTSRHLIASRDYYAAVTFSQQSAEKALKALFIFQNQKLPPRIHDLVKLGKLVEAPLTISKEGEQLTGTYLLSRYPGAGPDIPSRFYDQNKAEQHLQEAEVIFQWVQKKIQY